MALTESQMRFRAALADGLSLGNGASGLAGVIALLVWNDPRALGLACFFVFLGWGFDSVDGLAARGVKRAPAEGIVLDSLCDTSSFGVLPAVLLVAYGRTAGRPVLLLSTVLAIVFIGCVIARLRRYTVDALDHSSETRSSFKGVPSPVAAMSVAAAIAAAVNGPPTLAWLPMAFGALTAPLMLSAIPYQETPHVAGWMVRAKWPLVALAAIAYVTGSFTVMLTVFFAAYLSSGALMPRRAGALDTDVVR